jgi:hypothetical protein
MKKNSFCLPLENLVQILPESGSALDPGPHSSQMHITNADPKHCLTVLNSQG